MHRPPERLADRYVVQERIGEGASAITFRGWDERLERVVAIKFLRPALADDENYVQRFRQEARTAASVSHGNVVDVYDFGQEGASLYIVMQYVDGEDLKELITRDAPLAPSRVRAITGQVLAGLQAIHAAGIIHRDIKPQNVLIGRDGVARVTDFGVAHHDAAAGLTAVGTTVGTAAYMAPEQAQGGRISEATDLYAVGVMLYEMLTGFMPFNGPNAMATMLEHIQRDAVPPSQRLPGHGITPAMDNVVLQALAKQPERRFNSARAMRQAITHVFSAAGSQTTVAAPSAQSTMLAGGAPPVGMRQSERRAAPPRYAQEPVSAAYDDPRAPAPRDEGAGLKGAVRALLTVIVLGLFAALAWFLFDNLQNDNQGGSTDPTPTAEVTETPEPTATDEPGVILPVPTSTTAAPTPTETLEPTATLEPTPEPTATSEPTPTATSSPEPTEEQPIIEPMDDTALPTESGRANPPDEAHGNAAKNKDKNKEKKDKEREDDGGFVMNDASLLES